MRALRHHHAAALDGTVPHDVHRSGRATPWFIIAAVAFLAALTVGCSSGSDAAVGVVDADAVDADLPATDDAGAVATT